MLAGEHVVLEPLRRDHADDLVAAVSDGRLWELWFTSVPAPDGKGAEIDRRLTEQAAGRMLPFTVRRAGGAAVGMTTYMNIEADVRIPNHERPIGRIAKEFCHILPRHVAVIPADFDSSQFAGRSNRSQERNGQ